MTAAPQPVRVPWREIAAVAVRTPQAEALRHKQRGVWVLWSWAELTARAEQLGAHLQERHPQAALMAVSGEYAPSLLAFALAAARIGAAVVPVPTSVTPAALSEFLAGARPGLVFIGLREQVGVWRAALHQAGQAPAIIADYHLPWSRSPGTGVIAAADLLGPPPATAPAHAARDLLWIEEGTDWPDGLSYILHVAANGWALAFPESRTAAARDRRELQPAALAFSAAHHAEVQRDLAARLPTGNGLAARLTRDALDAAAHGRLRGHHRWLLARIRRPLGLARLRELTVVAPAGSTALDADADLFAALGIRSGRALPEAASADHVGLAFA